MKKKARSIIKKLPFYFRLYNWNAKRKQNRELAAWKQQGKPIPPPHKVKQQTLLTHAQRFGTDPAYPSVQALKEFIRSKRPNIDILVQDDSIRILPTRPSSANDMAATIG